MLKALASAYPSGQEFCVADIQKRLRGIPDLLVALDTEFGHGFFKTRKNLHPIKIGRLLQDKLAGKHYGVFELVALGKRKDVNYYRVRSHAAPVPVMVDPVQRGRDDALEATARYERRDEQQAPAPEPPKPQMVTTPPRIGRRADGSPILQPTKAELIARHNATQANFYQDNSGWGTGRPITPRRNFDL